MPTTSTLAAAMWSSTEDSILYNFSAIPPGKYGSIATSLLSVSAKFLSRRGSNCSMPKFSFLRHKLLKGRMHKNTSKRLNYVLP